LARFSFLTTHLAKVSSARSISSPARTATISETTRWIVTGIHKVNLLKCCRNLRGRRRTVNSRSRKKRSLFQHGGLGAQLQEMPPLESVYCFIWQQSNISSLKIKLLRRYPFQANYR